MLQWRAACGASETPSDAQKETSAEKIAAARKLSVRVRDCYDPPLIGALLRRPTLRRIARWLPLCPEASAADAEHKREQLQVVTIQTIVQNQNGPAV